MKKLIASASTGLAMLAASPLVSAVVMAADKSITDTGKGTTVTVPQPGGFPAVSLGGVVAAVMSAILLIATLLALIFLILGGIQWITSGGDKQGLEGARNKITSAIVGLIIVAASWAIMQLIANFVGIDIFGAGFTLNPISSYTN